MIHFCRNSFALSYDLGQVRSRGSARKWIAEQMIPNFPLNVFRDRAIEVPNNNIPPHKTVAELVEGERKAEGDAPAPKKQHHFRDLGIKIAGFGGQGVLLLGQLLAEMGNARRADDSKLAAFLWPGDALRERALPRLPFEGIRIGSPVISRPDVLVAMNEISLLQVLRASTRRAARSSTAASNCPKI